PTSTGGGTSVRTTTSCTSSAWCVPSVSANSGPAIATCVTTSSVSRTTSGEASTARTHAASPCSPPQPTDCGAYSICRCLSATASLSTSTHRFASSRPSSSGPSASPSFWPTGSGRGCSCSSSASSWSGASASTAYRATRTT